MTLAELEWALLETIRQGEIGVPVALRVNCQFGDRLTSALAGAVSLTHLVQTAFSESAPARLHARTTSDYRQLTVLASFPLGQTFFLTTTAIDGAPPAFDLLLSGNHGIVRLEGGDLFDSVSSTEVSVDQSGWKTTIERSLREQRAVEWQS